MIFTPVYRLEALTVQSLMALEWDGLTKERSALTILLQRDNPTGNPYLDHLHQYQRGREVFLNGPYEAMLVIENDIIPPVDTLWRLDELGCDVAYGVYVFRPRRKTAEKSIPRQLVVNVLERYGGWPNQARNIGESLTVRGLWESARRLGVVDCSGSGLGCVLIRRRVLEEVPFELPKDPGFMDWEWTQRVYERGYRMRADCNLICGHVDVDGEVLWPR